MSECIKISIKISGVKRDDLERKDFVMWEKVQEIHLKDGFLNIPGRVY